ncbi:MAG: XdhC family protein, partial [Bradyrhizobium sp.]|uniref:XdhC family protein n=1 Tax=Bradyrhizobium sp. TaxID=376 RepID=UPI0029048A2F
QGISRDVGGLDQALLAGGDVGHEDGRAARGALGSRKTHAKRGDRLRAQGASDADIARIHAPIGLAIGAVSPSEIAVSIMAEITATLRLPAKEKEQAA